jgi:hypothetical protein
MPILYVTTFAFLVITYWVDKYSFLKLCRIPDKLDKKVANLVRRVLKYFLVIHLVWSLWVFGSSTLFLDPNFEN